MQKGEKWRAAIGGQNAKMQRESRNREIRVVLSLLLFCRIHCTDILAYSAFSVSFRILHSVLFSSSSSIPFLPLFCQFSWFHAFRAVSGLKYALHNSAIQPFLIQHSQSYISIRQKAVFSEFYSSPVLSYSRLYIWKYIILDLFLYKYSIVVLSLFIPQFGILIGG